jgi:TRAP-type C4-dicarboxylate transport system substrate-binding protein
LCAEIPKRPAAGLPWYVFLFLFCVTVLSACATPLHVTVVAPESDHLAWQSARILQRDADAEGLTLLLNPVSTNTQKATPAPDLIVMPLRSLAGQLPALEILELPFFFVDLDAVHQAVDGELGLALRDIARRQQWEVLAFWDEGLHVMSGLRRYDRVVNLTGMEFLLTRADPMAERQFLAWRATPRIIRQADQETVLRECLIASRAATLQEIKREELERVHMTLSLTRHRYEGWLLLSPANTWADLPNSIREKITKILPQVNQAQRALAARREAEALKSLRNIGFVVHELDANARQAFIDRLPSWARLLPEEIDIQTREHLLTLSGIHDHNIHSRQALPAVTTP